MNPILQGLLLVLLIAAVLGIGFLVGRESTKSNKPTLNEMGVWTLADRLEKASDKAEVAAIKARESAEIIEGFVPVLARLEKEMAKNSASGLRVETAAEDARGLAAGVADALERSHEEADAVSREGEAGAAADASSRTSKRRP